MGQAMSFGLTQYDMEELMAHTGDKFSQDEIEALYSRFRALDRSSKGYISAEELLNIPELSINPLTRRLERIFDSVNFKEFVKILAAFSPRATREERVKFLFEVYDMDGDGKVSRDDLELMLRQLAGTSLRVSDGKVSREELALMMRQLADTCLGDEGLRAVVQQALEEAGQGERGTLSLQDFEAALRGADLTDMQVEVPSLT